MNLAPLVETFGQEDQSWLASAHGLSSARPVTIDVTKLTQETHYPNGYLPSGIPLAEVIESGLFAPYDEATSEVDTVTINGAPTGGFSTMTLDTDTTGHITTATTAAELLALLEALPVIGPGNVEVTGATGGPWTVTFINEKAGLNVDAFTHTDSFTGGSTPALAIATTTAGGTANAGDGTQTLVGHLFTSVEIVNRDGSVPATVVGAILDHCKVRLAKLPFPVDAAGMADVKGQIIYI